MRDSQEIVRELGELLDNPDPDRRKRILRAIIKESIPGKIRLLGNQVMAVGLGIDRWTMDGGSAGVVFVNKEKEPTVWQLNLGCTARAEDLPITARVDDGEQVHEICFERPGKRRFDITPVGPGEQRLFIVSTDKTWVPGGHDLRNLGVNVDVTPTGTLERLLEDPDKATRSRLCDELAREAFADKARLLGNQVVAAGLSPDHWTEDGAPAVLVYTNYDEQEVTPELVFACHAGPDVGPVKMVIEDGQRRREYTFEEPGSKAITLTPVAPHSKKLYIISADRTWSPGPGDPRQLGVSINVSPSWTLRQLMRKPDAYIRVKLAEVIANEVVPGKVELLDSMIIAVGITGDHWTEGDEPTALVVTNTLDEPMVPEVRLGCNGQTHELPLTVTVDDGQERTSVTFHAPGEQVMALTPVPRHSRRLFIFTTDRTWSPGGADDRDLGVSLAVEPSRVFSTLVEKYDPRAWGAVARAILDGQLPDSCELMPGQARAAGVLPDGWTRGRELAGVGLAHDHEVGGVVYELNLGCHAKSDDLPLEVALHDGGRQVTLTFEQSGEQQVILDPVEPGEDRLVIVACDGSWSPGGGDERELGVLLERVEISLRGTLSALLKKDDIKGRAWCLERIHQGDTPGQLCLLSDRVEAVGLTGDGWTTEQWPAALAVTNGGDKDLVLDIKLECHAMPEALPITALLDDGRERREVRFKERGRRNVTLDPIPAGESQLLIITTDHTWTPGTETDQRQLGVRITVEE